MVTVYQTASGDIDTIFDLLKRTGHEKAAQSQQAAIKKELGYIKRWLDKFAPEKVRFSVQTEPPKGELSKAKLNFLKLLRGKLKTSDMSPDNIHNSVYEASVEAELKPSEAFQTIYELFLNKTYGPKVGFFLACLDRDFVLKRLELEK
jgi:lysyl-tRNA synthetase class 1